MKNIIKKISKLFLLLGILVAFINVLPLLNVEAVTGPPGIQFNQPEGIILSQDGNSIIYKKLIEGAETEIGRVKVSYSNPTNNDGFIEKTPENENNNKIVQLPKFESFEIEQGSDIDSYEAKITFIPAEGYEIRSNPKLDDATIMMPGEEEGVYQRNITLNIKADGVIQYGSDTEYVTGMSVLGDVSFVLIGSPDGGDNPPPQHFPIFAKLSGIEEPIDANEDTILLPENWNTGEIEFYAKIFINNDGTIEPYDNQFTSGIVSNIRVDIVGPVDDANKSAIINNNKVILNSNFSKYAKAAFHVGTNMQNGGIGQSVAIVSSNYIGVKAIAEMGMTFSLGSEMETQATLTQHETTAGSVKIFFGNTETTLIPKGPEVNKIKSVTGASSVIYNNDGTATVSLPDISVETTTRVIIEFEMNDGTTKTKNLDIIRTAITLGYSDAEGKKTLYAGYVANKKYLYNNLDHDASGFDAYLQVILYKDNKVVGFRQVQIDDKDFIDDLNENETNGIECLDMEHAITLAGDGTDFDLDDVNGASVFLTNGPIDFNSETLPSIEYGIGAGVKTTWEAR